MRCPLLYVYETLCKYLSLLSILVAIITLHVSYELFRSVLVAVVTLHVSYELFCWLLYNIFHLKMRFTFSFLFSSLEPAWLRRDSDRLQYVRGNESLIPLLKMVFQVLRLPKNSLALGTIRRPNKNLPIK